MTTASTLGDVTFAVTSPDDFAYTWENFVDLRDFYQRAAAAGRAVIFTATWRSPSAVRSSMRASASAPVRVSSSSSARMTRLALRSGTRTSCAVRPAQEPPCRKTHRPAWVRTSIPQA
ncbi:DUF1877 family protein [Actinoplanes utahensis]|uniref:DUF1877 family protein n=1 Tax=Actinoplanes utahensis TaxID=1869 RepID=UPI0009FEAEE4